MPHQTNYFIKQFAYINDCPENVQNLTLQGNLQTNCSGIRNLVKWYHEASRYTNTCISTDCMELDWLDANLSAVWSALMSRLKRTHGLTFHVDAETLAKKFSILIRNGFHSDNAIAIDRTESFIQNASFGPLDDVPFNTYVREELLSQKQLTNLPPVLKGLLESNLEELRTNVIRHAATEDPLFVCGQFYPHSRKLKISFVDTGQTFLPPIHRCTNGAIITQQDAINWALAGNSEQLDGGGHALKCLLQVFNQLGHTLQIVSGDTFWDSSALDTGLGPFRELFTVMPGTIINFVFEIPEN